MAITLRQLSAKDRKNIYRIHHFITRDGMAEQYGFPKWDSSDTSAERDNKWLLDFNLELLRPIPDSVIHRTPNVGRKCIHMLRNFIGYADSEGRPIIKRPPQEMKKGMSDNVRYSIELEIKKLQRCLEILDGD